MKKTILLLIVFVAKSLMILYGQAKPDTLKTAQKYCPLSIELSFSPHYAFSFNPTTTSRQFGDFWGGGNGRLVYKVDSERTSISIGITYRRKKIAQSNSDNSGLATLLEFPIQVNYHLRKTVNKFDPYLKSSVRVCQFKVNYSGHVADGFPGSPNYVDYLLQGDIGYGADIKINTSIHFFFESSAGYSVGNVLPARAYLDLLTGFHFKL